jgi:tRNA (adenine22-N1)-methyltransferase
LLTKPKLSKRLQTIIDFVPQANIVADIGCDHAYVSISLVLNNKANHVIGVDNKLRPLRIAERNVALFEMKENVTLLRNPIDTITQPIDGCIIAGVGKESAVAMLDEFESTFQSSTWICIQVNAKVIELRKHMATRGYRLIKETVVYDKAFYVILLYEKGIEQFSGVPLIVGPYITQNIEENREYLNKVKEIAANFRLVAHDFSKQSMYASIDDYLQGIL